MTTFETLPRWWITVAALFVSAVLLSPFYWVLVGSFMTPAELFGGHMSLWPKHFAVENWSVAWGRLWPHIQNSLLVSAVASIGTLLITAPAAYGLVWRKPRGRQTLSAFMLMTQMLPATIWVRFSLSESDLAKLPQRRLVRGAQVEVSLILADGTRYPGKGRLNFAATQIDTRLGTQQLRAEFDNAKGQLLPGQFVRTQLVAGQRENVFLVPQTAVMEAEAGYMLFVMDKEGKAALRPVQMGDWIGADWMVLGGLAAGDRVIVDNLLKLRPGVAVSPLAPGPDKSAESGTSKSK